jgi:hypothetical protein
MATRKKKTHPDESESFHAGILLFTYKHHHTSIATRACKKWTDQKKERENWNWSGFTQFLAPTGFPFTLWLFNIAMENDPFIVDFPIKTSIYKGFSMAMFNNQMVLGKSW